MEECLLKTTFSQTKVNDYTVGPSGPADPNQSFPHVGEPDQPVGSKFHSVWDEEFDNYTK